MGIAAACRVREAAGLLAAVRCVEAREQAFAARGIDADFIVRADGAVAMRV